MFCQKCGCQNAGDAVFCRKCGTSLEQDELDQWLDSVMPEKKQLNLDVLKKVVQPRKTIQKWIFVLAGEIILSVVLLFSFFQKMSGLFRAETIAEHYFVALANGEWEEAYSMLELEEGEFTGKEAYCTYFENNSLPPITAYSMQGENQNGTLGKNVTILYRERGASSDMVYQISLNKQIKNKYIFFENWTVSTESFLSKAVPVTVPHGAAVSIEGIPLREAYLSETENGLDSYSIPAMFTGQHQIEVSMPGMETVKEVFDAGWDGYYLYNMQISQDTLQELLGQAEMDMQKIYMAAFQRTAFEEISDLFVADGEKTAEIESSYNSLIKEMTGNEYYQVETLDMTSLVGEAYGSAEEGICAVVNVSFEYRILYSYLDSWENVRKSDTYNSEDELSFYYVLENGRWCLSNLGCHSLYY